MKNSVFIPVRLSSTRLPEKALIEIEGKPCLQYLIERIKTVKNLDGIIICTTSNKSDDKIVEFAKKMKVDFFRGSEKDILDRFNKAAIEFDVENIVNVDGDDIFCEPKFIEITMNELQKTNSEYLYWKNLPLGTTPIGIKSSSLKQICNLKNIDDTETGWGKFFTETKMFNVKSLTTTKSELLHPEIRLTLDYPEDLELFKQIIKNLKNNFNLHDIVSLLNKRKDFQEINDSVKTAYWENFVSKSSKVSIKEK